MKKTTLVVFVALVFIIPSFSLNAYTTITGANGYFTIPITNVRNQGTLSGAMGYISEVNNLYTAVNVVVLKNWEISGAKEFPLPDDTEMGFTPWILGTKWTFYEKETFKTTIGGQIEFLDEGSGYDSAPFTIYAAVSDYAGVLGYVNAGLGYTFNIDAEYHINFFFGTRRHIIEDMLFVVGEFSNYSVRQGFYTAWDERRGIFNFGLVFEPFKFAAFNIVAYDMLDNFITVGLGGEVHFDLW